MYQSQTYTLKVVGIMQDRVDHLFGNDAYLQHWLYVVHLHGLFYKGNFVLSPDDYNKSVRKDRLVPFMQALVNDRSIVRL